MKALILTIATLIAGTSQAGLDRQRGEFHRNQIEKQRVALATSLVVAHKEGYICDADAYTSSTVQAIANVSSWRSTAAKNLKAKIADNKQLRENLALKYIVSGNVTETAGSLAAALIKTRLYSPGEGMYGSTVRVYFKSTNEAIVSRLDANLDNPKFVDTKATWTLAETEEAFVLTLNYDGNSRIFTLGKEGLFYKTRVNGELTFEGDLSESIRNLKTSPSECEA